MRTFSRALVLAAGALGTLTACSTGAQEAASPTGATTGTAVAPMPSSATFIADVPEEGGETMTMAITVEGEKVVAYATNGTDDESYFVGTQKNGQMDLMSMYGDNLKASFDGAKVNGEVAMNETGTAPVKFAASFVAAPAGLYTAAHDNMRATWVVRPDRTMTGVMDNSAPGDHKVTDAIAAREQAFKDKVRQMRLDRQLQQAPHMTYGTWSMQMDGSTVTAVRVTGDMSF
jgi:hypothetical protein